LSSKAVVIVVVALAVAIASVFLLPTGNPHVIVKAEPLFYIAGSQSLPFTNSLFVMLIVDVTLIAVAVGATGKMQLVPRGLQNIMEAIIEMFYNVFAGVNKEWLDRGPTFAIVSTIFFFVLFANWLGLIPLVGPFGICKTHETEQSTEKPASGFAARLASIGTTDTPQASGLAAEAAGEKPAKGMILGCKPGQSIVPFFRSPSADLNFTFGLALLAFGYIEYIGFQALGVGYLGKFFNFKEAIMGILVGLLELISEFARILAFAFRLFGNIFAGEVLLVVMAFLVPLALPLPFYMFEVFVGFIQAFVFAILTMAFIAIAVTPPHGGEHH